MLSESDGHKKDVYRAFHVKDHASLQDVLHCMMLSETVYKAYEGGPSAVSSALAALQTSFHPSLSALKTVQCSLSHVQHRYIISSSAEALYVAFMGTKVLRDYLADANYLQAALWPGEQALAGQSTLATEHLGGAGHPELAAAHQGFLARSQRVPVELLYLRARQQGKRLVLCGHSLGGAVAKLCTLRLLHQLDSSESAQGHVRCVAFAAPALGNAALASLVSQQGWSHAFYNLTLPEDIVPRLLAMRYAASLPAAAQEAVSQPQEAAQEDTAKADAPVPEPEDEGFARPSWRSTTATAAGSPVRSRWHTSLSSSMDKLRALTGSTTQRRSAVGPPDVQTQLDAAAPEQRQHRSGAQEQPASQRQSQQGATWSQYAPSWGPARYLPSFVPFGGQHHLYAPATASAATPQPSSAVRAPETSEATEAEDAEALAALRSQGESSLQAQAPAGGEVHLRASSDSSEEGSREQPDMQPASRPSSPPGFATGTEQAAAGRTANARKYALPLLTYHRMYTMRERAAAICSAAWPLDDAVSRSAVKLCQDLAPPLLVKAANAQLPVLPPSPTRQSTLEPAYKRWSPTALWSSTSEAFARRLPPGVAGSRASQGTKGQSWAPAGLLGLPHRILASGQGALEQLRSSAQPQPPEGQEPESGTLSVAANAGSRSFRAAGSWWSPWTAPAAPQALQAPSPQKARPWLPSGASGWVSSSPQEGTVRLPITVSGRGLAGCTSARLQTRDGSFHEARITSAPAVSLTSLTGTQQGGDPQPSSRARLQVIRQKMVDVGRYTWQRLQSRGAPTAQPAAEAPMEQLLLEAKLKPADAQGMVSSFSEHGSSHSRGSSPLKAYLRSDFEVVGAEVVLTRRQAWVLGSSLETLDRVMTLLGALAAKHAFLPGVKTAAADAVSYTCLAPASHDLALVAQLASQHIQTMRPLGDYSQTSAEEADAPDGDRLLSPSPHMAAASEMLRPLSRGFATVFPAYRSQAVEAAKAASTAVASTLEHARLLASQTTAAATARLQRLRHRHTVLAMQQQSTPDVVVICFSESSTFVGEGQTQRQSAPVLHPSYLRGRAPAADSIAEICAVTSLVENAHRAGIPALVIVLTEYRDVEICKAECEKALRLSDAERLVILSGKPSSSDAFRLKRALFDCLGGSKLSSTYRSKL